MPPEDIVSLQVSLINMAHKCYPEKREYVDTVLDVTKKLFDNVNIEMIEYCTPVGRELEKLLLIPINNFNDMINVLKLPHFAPLLGYVKLSFFFLSIRFFVKSFFFQNV